MCIKEFSVIDIPDRRTAYEVEEYLIGLPHIDRVHADVVTDTVTVDYNENEINDDRVLDHIEHAGCDPSERASGVIDQIKNRFQAL